MFLLICFDSHTLLFYFTLSLTLSSFQILMHTLCQIFSRCRFRFSTSRLPMERFSISRSAAPVKSPQSLRTIFIFCFNYLNLQFMFFQTQLGISWNFQSVRGHFRTQLYSSWYLSMLSLLYQTLRFSFIQFQYMGIPII